MSCARTNMGKTCDLELFLVSLGWERVGTPTLGTFAIPIFILYTLAWLLPKMAFDDISTGKVSISCIRTSLFLILTIVCGVIVVFLRFYDFFWAFAFINVLWIGFVLYWETTSSFCRKKQHTNFALLMKVGYRNMAATARSVCSEMVACGTSGFVLSFVPTVLYGDKLVK